MTHILRLPSLFLLVAISFSGLRAQPFDAPLPPLDPSRAIASTVEGPSSRGPSTVRRVFGHLNVVGTPDLSRDGIGFFDVPAAPPPSLIIPTTKLAGNPVPYEELTPGGGTLGPNSLFYFVGFVNDDVSDLALYTLDPTNPSAGYVLVSDGVEDGLLAVGTEFPVGLGYNEATGTAVMATRLCSEVEGVYYQSFLYEIDLTDGTLINRRELRDPTAPVPGNEGVCLFSASWEEGGRVFGADAATDIAEIDATTGLLVARYPITASDAENVERIQSAAFDPQGASHNVFAFTLEREGEDVVAAYTRAFRCATGTGCEFLGFIAEFMGGASFTVEVLTAAFLPDHIVAADPGAPTTGATLAVYPNPAVSNASVDLRLASAEAVSVTVLDLLGRTVAVLHEGQASQLDLNLSGLPSGVYFVHARGESFNAVRKLVVTR